ncbi:MAG: hypothetical protein ABT940_01475 [Alphaproteobacteria bacterium]
MRGLLWSVSVLAALLPASGGSAAQVSFTAEAVQTVPGQPGETGRVFVSEQGMRFEFQRQGRQVVQIVQPKEGLMRLLLPQEKIFAEFRGRAMPANLAERAETPCPPPQEARCERLPDTTLDGASVQAWRVVLLLPPQGKATQASESEPVLLWWDAKNRVVVRQQLPDGSSARTVMVGRAVQQGRQVDRWETTQTLATGQTIRSSRLHDPELSVDIREEYPGGTVREMRNIAVVRPDPSWYAVPSDYRKVDPAQVQPILAGQAPASHAPVPASQIPQDRQPPTRLVPR